MIFDIHSHIIPGVDDGSSSLEESIEMLKALKRQGVDKVIATPHFYASKASIHSYVSRISAAFSNLVEKTETLGLPELFCGSEVHYFRGMSRSEDLKKLCIHSSRYILLELPYVPLDTRIVDEIKDIVINMELIPILAHIDRYLSYNRYEDIMKLFQYGDIRGQVNADALCYGMGKKRALQFLKEDACIYLGSDTHNMQTRPPKIEQALGYIKKKLGEEGIEQISLHSENLFRDLMGVKLQSPMLH